MFLNSVLKCLNSVSKCFESLLSCIFVQFLEMEEEKLKRNTYHLLDVFLNFMLHFHLLHHLLLLYYNYWYLTVFYSLKKPSFCVIYWKRRKVRKEPLYQYSRKVVVFVIFNYTKTFFPLIQWKKNTNGNEK